MAALLLMLVPIGPALAAQAPDAETTYDAELLNWEIKVTGPTFALQDTALEEYPHGRGERIYVSGVDSLAFAEIAFFDDADTPDQTIDVMLSEFENTSQSFTTLDRGESDGVSYAFVKFQISDEFSGYFYIEVAPDVSGNTDFAQSLYTINEDFLTSLSLAQAEIIIQGNAFLGAPAIDLDAIVAADLAAATPLAQATPARTGYTFQTVDGELQVQPPVTYDYPLLTNHLEAAYISSPVGFGFVGYQRQETDSAAAVIESIIAEAPMGEAAPRLLELQENGEHATAVYRIAIDGGFTIMVIDVTNVDANSWQIEALAVRESDFLAEMATFQQAVMVNGTPFLDAISVEEVDAILNTNKP